MTRTTDDSGELIREALDNQIEKEARGAPEAAAETPPGRESQVPEPEAATDGLTEKEDGEPGAAAETGPGEKESEEEVKEPEAAEGPPEKKVVESESAKDSPEKEVGEPESSAETASEEESEIEDGNSEVVPAKERGKLNAESTPKAENTSKKRKKKAPEKSVEEDPEEDDSEETSIGLNLFTFFVLLIAALITVGYYTCTVRTVIVTGNHLYTSKEIAEKVISDDTQLRHNTLFLTALYMTPLAPQIPFEESVTVTPESYDTIRITVKDMDIAGFIPYAGKKLYFSADGKVLENSPLTVKNSTFVTGLSITEAQIGEKMASDNETGLNMVLEVLQILRKYQMEAECVVLTERGNVVMYMGEIKVQLGKTGFELKISKIAQILPYLEGRSGTINMTNYTEADQNIILK